LETNTMSEYDNAQLQELLANAFRREKTGARWAYFSVHLVMSLLATLLMWILVLTGTEPLGAGAILLTLLAFFGVFLHLRNVLADSGMYQRSSAELIAQELVRRGVVLNDTPGEKNKRLPTVHLTDDGELVADDSVDEQSVNKQRAANSQLRN